jgi:hypothetical protein
MSGGNSLFKLITYALPIACIKTGLLSQIAGDYQAGNRLVCACIIQLIYEVCMPRPVIIVGPAIGHPFETGARIFAALAFPGSKENEGRQNADDAWIADFLKKVNEVDEDDSPFEDARLAVTKGWAVIACYLS